MTDARIQIPRRSYAGVMLAATAAGAAAAWFISRAAAPGNSHGEATIALTALLIGSIATFAPAILSFDASHWGIAVMGSGVVRGLLMIVVAYAMLNSNPDAVANAVTKGAVVGAVLILTIEAAAAIRILSRIDSHTRSSRAPMSATPGSQA